ncbi:SDR family oxidoreductase [Lapillicoccus jejuensis]|uniref:NADP-dependent 3-hydroxy acid dehydrogenase YdfG n=1 Tax=Lapillicoccus jejuensis TaxID=402171 RepID=A0A542E1Y6_9MICO|nr:SDR family oxidoreductase [Lapillicoccus jejuensis]TQJ09348.1 NADP-dependent 3-hydroxy acid dehydrogenase YdfG [Lapillicoccus jejuensis]
MDRHPHLDLPDLHGRRALVTGASDGIGLHIATRLAAAGAQLVLPVRNAAKGAAALERLRAEVPGARVELETLDLSSLGSVATLADRLLDREEPLHLLVANAGVMTPPARTTTEDGFELQLGTNHLGHVALVGRLMPLLVAGRARVVTQSSVAARRATIAWDDLQSERSYDAMRAYAQSKLAIGLFGLELERRSAAAGWGVTATVAHPGVAPTSLLAARPEVGRARDTLSVRAIRVMSRIGLTGTPESAALPALLAATAPSGGGFHGPQGPGSVGGRPGELPLWRPLASAQDAARMWDLSHELVGVRVG